jgi:hypothetical protein
VSSISRKDDLCGIDLSGAAWRKSSYSSGGEHCLEIADLPGCGVAIRDFKHPERESLRYTADEWHAFRRNAIDGAL